MKTGLFNDAYKNWNKKPVAKKTFTNWRTFWHEELKSSLDVSKAAGQCGYGNAATGTPTDVDAEFSNSVDQFA